MRNTEDLQTFQTEDYYLLFFLEIKQYLAFCQHNGLTDFCIQFLFIYFIAVSMKMNEELFLALPFVLWRVGNDDDRLIVSWSQELHLVVDGRFGVLQVQLSS